MIKMNENDINQNENLKRSVQLSPSYYHFRHIVLFNDRCVAKEKTSHDTVAIDSTHPDFPLGFSFGFSCGLFWRFFFQPVHDNDCVV